MSRRVRRLRKLAEVLMATPDGRHFGWDLSRAARLRSGQVYRMLHWLLDWGWLTDGWEDPDLIGYHRPPRRFYTVTDQGRLAMAELLNSTPWEKR